MAAMRSALALVAATLAMASGVLGRAHAGAIRPQVGHPLIAAHVRRPARRLRARTVSAIPPEPRLSVCTVATHSAGYLDVLRESCSRGGVELSVLGYGARWGGWAWRAQTLAAHLRTLAADELVVVVDAFDVALLADARTLRERFAAFGAPIVFGVAERARIDRPALGVWYGRCCGENLNAGGYMGAAGALLELLELYSTAYAHERDDQLAFTRICCETGFFSTAPGVALDTRGELFYNAGRTLRPGTALGLRLTADGRWACARTGATPCVLHAVGGQDMRKQLRAVGLNVSTVVHRNYALHLVRNEPQRAALFAAVALAALAALGRAAVRLAAGV